jgi:hypothetical protein
VREGSEARFVLHIAAPLASTGLSVWRCAIVPLLWKIPGSSQREGTGRPNTPRSFYFLLYLGSKCLLQKETVHMKGRKRRAAWGAARGKKVKMSDDKHFVLQILVCGKFSSILQNWSCSGGGL